MKSRETKEVKLQNTAQGRMIGLYLLIFDMFAVNFAYFFGLWLRFDFRYSQIPPEYLNAFIRFAPFYTVIAIGVFYVLKLYNSLWLFASFDELNRAFAASLITAVVHIAGIRIFVRQMPYSYYLIGAGAAGQVIIRELKNSAESDARPVCVIDDDPQKWGKLMAGIPVVGGRDRIMEAAKEYNADQIMFAIPTASAEAKRDILNICKETGCELMSLPGVYQLTNGDVSVSRMKAVAVEDLLGRDSIKVNMDEIFRYIKGKTILVTGGGGSIGSELCRQIAGHEPKQLIIFDIYENNAYEIEQELKRKYKDLNLVVLIGSVRDSRRINSVFETYHPQIVYHAAAHKHVPLMETSPNESIKNNVIGTYKTAYAALKNGAERFVLISTDKAVNPTNIMGASKRLCEMVIQSMDAVSKDGRMELLPFVHAHGDETTLPNDPEDVASVEHSEVLTIESVSNKERKGTQFVAVRFGNVLGSNGSVIPLFKKQIEAGGPVTVTHPDIVRYFMTIPEAVSLVLQADTYAWGGERGIIETTKKNPLFMRVCAA